MSICKALDMSLVDLLCDEEESDQTIQTEYILDENYIVELFRNSDYETKRRLLRYFELMEICEEINKENGFFRIITYSPEFLCRTVHQFCGQ